jgi:hypothetical protein
VDGWRVSLAWCPSPLNFAHRFDREGRLAGMMFIKRHEGFLACLLAFCASSPRFQHLCVTWAGFELRMGPAAGALGLSLAVLLSLRSAEAFMSPGHERVSSWRAHEPWPSRCKA